MHGRRRLLIISHGPVPTPEHPRVEGGDLRCWGLARGIRANSPEIDITVACHEADRQTAHTSEADGIRIATWNHDTIGSLAGGADSVLTSDGMGELSVRLARGLARDQQLILDCYVPDCTEAPAGDVADVGREQAEFAREHGLWTEALRRGDLFLCADPAQGLYYQGALRAAGRINPLTRGRPLLLEVPTERWDLATGPLARAIERGDRAPDLVIDVPPDRSPRPEALARTSRLARVVHLARRLPGHLKEHGVRETAARVHRRLARRLRDRAAEAQETGPRIVVLSHRLDLSGAPYVLMDVLAEMVARGLRGRIRLFAYPPAHASNLDRLAGLGVATTLLPHPGAVPPFATGDVVLLNTTGFAPAVREAILAGLERGTIEAAFWYVHEDTPERIFSASEASRIRRLGAGGRLHLVAPAHQTLRKYAGHFGMEVLHEPYHIDLPGRDRVREAGDFETLRFIMPGTFLDGRKGQHAVLYALADFYRRHFEPRPEDYREFRLTFVGVEEDWYSTQVVRHRRVLGDRVVLHPKRSRDACLDLIGEANVTICYSQGEVLPIFVFEGMLAGHPILRNGCSGLEEQLEPDRNGFRLDSEDFWQVVDTFERVLNRRATTNERLAAMSARSREIALAQRDNHYARLIDRIQASLDGRGPLPSRPHFPGRIAARVRSLRA